MTLIKRVQSNQGWGLTMRILVSEELRDDGIPTVTISVNAPGSARDAGTTCGRVEPTQAVISC